MKGCDCGFVDVVEADDVDGRTTVFLATVRVHKFDVSLFLFYRRVLSLESFEPLWDVNNE